MRWAFSSVFRRNGNDWLYLRRFSQWFPLTLQLGLPGTSLRLQTKTIYLWSIDREQLARRMGAEATRTILNCMYVCP